MTSERTRNALAEAKKRGVELGKNGKVLAVQRRQEAAERAEALRPMIMPMVEAGLSYSEIARRLNEQGVQTVNGRRFHAQQVKQVVGRLIPISR